MAKVHDQMAATAFAVKTKLTFDEVAAAATDAAHRASGPMTKAYQKGIVPGSRIDFAAARIKAISIAEFSLVFKAGTGAEANTLALQPGNFLTTRPAVAGFIPIGPSTCAGLPIVQKFSSFMKATATQ